MRVLLESIACDSLEPEKVRPYFESTCVSLYSASQSNPDTLRMLVINIEVPGDLREILETMGRKTVKQPFDNFDCGQDVTWGLTHHKPCALKRVAEMGSNGVRNPYIANRRTRRHYSVFRCKDQTILHLPSEKIFSLPKVRPLLKADGIDEKRFLRWSGLRLSQCSVDPVWVAMRILQKAGVSR